MNSRIIPALVFSTLAPLFAEAKPNHNHDALLAHMRIISDATDIVMGQNEKSPSEEDKQEAKRILTNLIKTINKATEPMMVSLEESINNQDEKRKPTPAEIAQGKRLLAEFRAVLNKTVQPMIETEL